MAMTIRVDYFSDVLCVWAFINESRLQEVKDNLGKDLDINMLFLPNFLDCHNKINNAWAERGGFEGYAEHVVEVVEKFDITLHNDTWFKVRPSTSMLAHSAIQSVLAVHNKEKAADFCSAIRQGFFINALDISQWQVLEEIALKLDIDWGKVDQYFYQGSGLANLQQNFQQAAAQHITISPAWVFNEGRQKLIGNVGYRVIEANLKELIENKPLPQAWC